MKLSMIVAVSQNGVIGKDNQIPWRLPDDLKFFKEKTIGHPIIMGRKTFESLGKPLPGRLNIVLTSKGGSNTGQVIYCKTPTEALNLAQKTGTEEAFIIGGDQIYQTFLAQADKLYVTRVEAEFEGDRFFSFPADQWLMVESNARPIDDRHSCAFVFQTYIRKNQPKNVT